MSHLELDEVVTRWETNNQLLKGTQFVEHLRSAPDAILADISEIALVMQALFDRPDLNTHSESLKAEGVEVSRSEHDGVILRTIVVTGNDGIQTISMQEVERPIWNVSIEHVMENPSKGRMQDITFGGHKPRAINVKVVPSVGARADDFYGELGGLGNRAIPLLEGDPIGEMKVLLLDILHRIDGGEK